LNVNVRKLPTPASKQFAKPQTPVVQHAMPVATHSPVKVAVTANAERRKNQRVLLRIRASLHVAMQGKNAVLDAATLSVTAQGAVIVTNQNLPAETHLVLEHGATGQRVDCKVARTPKATAEGFHTPIEFSAPAPGFWKINFPPSSSGPEAA
jgi:hypothetical protein